MHASCQDQGYYSDGMVGAVFWGLGIAALWGSMCPGDFWEVLRFVLGFPPCAHDPLGRGGVKPLGWELMLVGLGADLWQHLAHPVPS